MRAFLLVLVLLTACASPGPATPVPYNEVVSGQLRRLGQAGGQLDELLSRPAFTDNAWRLQISGQVSELEGVYETLAGLKPPSEQISRHVDLLSATGDCAAAMRLLTLAIDDADQSLLDPTFRLINRCTTKITAMAQAQ